MGSLNQHILTVLSPDRALTSTQVRDQLPKRVSRQYVARVLRKLILEGKVQKQGSTRNARYLLVHTYHYSFSNKNAEEHVVLTHVKERLPTLQELPKNVASIFTFAFSEMVNNALEHSGAPRSEVTTDVGGKNVQFQVDDSGVGAFRNIMQTRKLSSELEAVQDLLKGKTTTMPRSHSGEGIFFTSKIADVFELVSYDYRLVIDNTINDLFVGRTEQTHKGTRVKFRIEKTSQKHLQDVFAQYTNLDDASNYGFDKTEVKVRLYAMGGVFISRSQARRVLAGLEKFRVIVLDFDRISTIGQAFADEVFRVFQTNHPNIRMESVNTNDAVQFMLDRVEKPDTGTSPLFAT